MKVILYVATTINGMIAKEDDSAPFLTPEESASYVEHVKNAGALVVGRKTYQVLSTQPEFQEFLKAEVRIAVISRNTEFKLDNPLHAVAHSPEEALKMFDDQEQIIVAGGGSLNNSFLARNLIDEIYLDIEPYFLSKGIQLAYGDDLEIKLKLLGTRNLTDKEIQLHYQVLKSE